MGTQPISATVQVPDRSIISMDLLDNLNATSLDQHQMMPVQHQMMPVQTVETNGSLPSIPQAPPLSSALLNNQLNRLTGDLNTMKQQADLLNLSRMSPEQKSQVIANEMALTSGQREGVPQAPPLTTPEKKKPPPLPKTPPNPKKKSQHLIPSGKTGLLNLSPSQEDFLKEKLKSRRGTIEPGETFDDEEGKKKEVKQQSELPKKAISDDQVKKFTIDKFVNAFRDEKPEAYKSMTLRAFEDFIDNATADFKSIDKNQPINYRVNHLIDHIINHIGEEMEESGLNPKPYIDGLRKLHDKFHKDIGGGGIRIASNGKVDGRHDKDKKEWVVHDGRIQISRADLRKGKLNVKSMPTPSRPTGARIAGSRMREISTRLRDAMLHRLEHGKSHEGLLNKLNNEEMKLYSSIFAPPKKYRGVGRNRKVSKLSGDKVEEEKAQLKELSPIQ